MGCKMEMEIIYKKQILFDLSTGKLMIINVTNPAINPIITLARSKAITKGAPSCSPIIKRSAMIRIRISILPGVKTNPPIGTCW